MITKLEIKGFKSLVDVSIELGAVNVFIGANGSGKSNLLEAVGVLSAIVINGPQSESIYYRGVRVGAPSSYLSSFKTSSSDRVRILVGNAKTEYEVEFGPDPENQDRWRVFEETLWFENEVLFTIKNALLTIPARSGRPEKNITIPFLILSKTSGIKVGLILYQSFVETSSSFPSGSSEHLKALEFSEIINSVDVFLNELFGYCVYSPSTPILRGSTENNPREPLGIGGSGLGHAIHDMLKVDKQKLGPFDLDDVFELIDWANALQAGRDDEKGSNSILEAGPARIFIGDKFMGEKHKSVSLLEASEGALYVLFMLAVVGHEQSSKIFAVDNFDQSLHPRLARELTERICDQILDDGTRQMLATTHNPLVLDGLDLLDDRIRLFTVDRDKTGASQVKRVLVTEELIDKGLSLSRLWTSGRFGGVPKYL